MSCLMLATICSIGALVVGWFILPAPKVVQQFWVDRGWVDRVP